MWDRGIITLVCSLLVGLWKCDGNAEVRLGLVLFIATRQATCSPLEYDYVDTWWSALQSIRMHIKINFSRAGPANPGQQSIIPCAKQLHTDAHLVWSFNFMTWRGGGGSVGGAPGLSFMYTINVHITM